MCSFPLDALFCTYLFLEVFCTYTHATDNLPNIENKVASLEDIYTCIYIQDWCGLQYVPLYVGSIK